MQVESEVKDQVASLAPPVPPQLPPGHHRRRKSVWTPAEYLTLIGERSADEEAGFTLGVAGQPIRPRTTLPPLDSSLPTPLIEAGENLREVHPEELQGPNRSKLMLHVYGGETSSHQRKLAFCYDSRDWKAWIAFFNEFKTLAGREGWTELQKLNQLRSRISGQTSASVNRIEHVCGRMTSVEDLYAACQYHVLGETAVTDSRTRLDTRSRGPDESIREYAYALVDLAQLAYPGSQQDHVHKACERFIPTVTKNVEIRKMLYRYFYGHPNPSIETLVSMSIKAERSEEKVEQELAMEAGQPHATTSKLQLSRTGPTEQSSNGERSDRFMVAAMRNNSSTRDHRSRDSSRHRSRQSRSRSRSSSRSRAGPFKSSRRSRSRSTSRSRDTRGRYSSKDRSSSKDRYHRNPSRSSSRTGETCYRCGGRGHYANECPSPPSVQEDRKPSRDEKGYKNKSQKSEKPVKRSPSRNRKKVDFMEKVLSTLVAFSKDSSDSEDDAIEKPQKSQ